MEKNGVIDRMEEHAVTVRPTSTAVFAVDSDDRYATYADRRTKQSYPFTFNIVRNQALLNGFFTRVALTEFRMFWTLPNISAAWGNNTLQIFITGAPSNPYTITLLDGFYDLQSLVAVIEDSVQQIGLPGPALLPNFVGIANDDGTTTWSNGGGGAPTFYWVKPTSNVRTLYDMLNLITPAPPFVPAQNSARGGVCNLRPTDFIDIVCPQITYNQDLKDGSSQPIVRDILTRIYLDDSTKSMARYTTNVFDNAGVLTGTQLGLTDPTVFTNGSTPFTIYRQFASPKQILWNKNQPIGNLVFELYDDQGRSIQDLWNAAYPISDPTGDGVFYSNSFVWNMTLLISEN